MSRRRVIVVVAGICLILVWTQWSGPQQGQSQADDEQITKTLVITTRETTNEDPNQKNEEVALNVTATDSITSTQAKDDTQGHQDAQATPLQYAIVTFYCGWQPEYVKAALANKEQYAKRHGYPFLDLSTDPFVIKACEKSSFMARYDAVALTLPKYDGVLWADVDAIFLNHSRKLEEIMDIQFDLFITAGPPTSRLWAKFSNNGHFFVRNTKWGNEFINEIAELSSQRCRNINNGQEIITHINWMAVCNQDGSWGMNDQGLMMVVVRNHTDPKWLCHVKHVPFREFNSEFPWYGNGDLMIHLPGRRGDERLEIFQKFFRAADFNTGIVDLTKEPDLEPKSDNDLNGISILADIKRLYEPWNTPCSL